MQLIHNYINGEFAPPHTGKYLNNFLPHKGKIYSQVPDSGEEDIKVAVAAAKTAFPAWSKMTVENRSEILMKIHDMLLENLDRLAKAESEDTGKPLWLARTVDIPRAASNFRFFATGILHFASESHAMESGAVNYTLRKPLGVVGCISPWNLPLYLFTWKIAPALAAGNTVVAKPSELTPMTAYLLSEICHEAGLPAGVLNIVHGLGATTGAAIVDHPDVKAISFTGGTKTGAEIARIAAPKFKKLSLELGGKNPAIIFDDVDLEAIIPQIKKLAFTNQGQICLCGSRILVHEKIYTAFKEKFIAEIKTIKVGNPAEDQNFMGALISEGHFEKIKTYVKMAREDGGKILTGGNAVQVGGEFSDGYFHEPTVIEGLGPSSLINQEEIFGPVVTLIPFRTEEEALTIANDTGYGLAATLWTNDITRVQRMTEKLEFGIVWVNCWMIRDLRTPFGGVKNSGVGREGGWEALRFFTEPKNICIKYA